MDLHLHVPEGAIPKDGPSAGITLVTALVSLLTGRPVRPRVAMTGEMTLSGRVLPVGGIKEKVLAAHRLGIKEVILPKRNEKAVKEDIPENVRNDLKIHLVSSIEEVLELALTPGEVYSVRDKEPLAPPAVELTGSVTGLLGAGAANYCVRYVSSGDCMNAIGYALSLR